MTRSGFKKLWLLVIAIMFASSVYMYNMGSEYRNKISRAEMKKERLTFELNAGNQLSAALEDLDNFTMNESNATRLDVLRYLSLETSDLSFKPLAKSERKFGPTTLYTRRFSISGDISYADALEQIDWLHNTNKLTLNNVEIKPGSDYGDVVNFKMEGTMYGLYKN